MTELVYFDSHNTVCKKPFGAVSCGQRVELSLTVRSGDPRTEACLILWGTQLDREKLTMDLQESREDCQIYGITFTVPAEPGLLWYYFQITLEGMTYYYGNYQRRRGGPGQLQAEPPLPYQITVYRAEGCPWPGSWYLDGIVYHIFADRFFNGSEDGRVLNPRPGSLLHGCWEDTPLYLRDKAGRVRRWDFFGGNLAGIRRKLPYLRELGVSVLYLSPIFSAPSNHKYDTADYLEIDPMFGSEEELRLLCREAGEQGIYIILDGVFSHTGSDSVYFNKEGNYPGLGAYQSQDSPYYPWYRFEEYPAKYQCWWGIDSLPNVNEMEPSYLDFIVRNPDSVIRHWMRAGVRGWRLDVADELPDAFIRELAGTVKEMDEEGVVIGEVWEDASNKLSYGEQRQFLWGGFLDGVTNYPFRRIVLDYVLGLASARETHLALTSLAENYPPPSLAASLNILGSHDVPRILSLLGGGTKMLNLPEEEQEKYRLAPEERALAKKRLKLLASLQFTYPGVPCIYYGDEAGLEGLADPYNRGPFPWGKEDRELLAWYRALGRLRREKEVLRRGAWLSLGPELEEDNPGTNVYGYIRTLAGEVALILVNPDPKHPALIQVRQENLGCLSLEQVWTKQALAGAKGVFQIRLEPLESAIFLGKRGV